MTIEIKFRAWDIKNNRWHAMWGNLFPWGTKPDDKEKIIIGIMPAYFIFEQFTGLKDKNGTEIYCGDIVRYRFDIDTEKPPHNSFFVGVVIWADWNNDNLTGYNSSRHIGFIFEGQEKNGKKWLTDISKGLDMEIVGNIHENKELIGGK